MNPQNSINLAYNISYDLFIFIFTAVVWHIVILIFKCWRLKLKET